MPETPGEASSEGRAKLVRDLVDLQDYWLKALTTRFSEMVSDHKLYLGHREDKRKAHEQWRSWSWLGDPYRMTRIEVDAWLEIMNSLDIPLQAEGVSTEDEWKARGFERYGDYFLRANKWTQTQEMMFRHLSIRGWQPLKTGWREIKFKPLRRPSLQERKAFDVAINQGLQEGKISEPPGEKSTPDEWRQWYEDNSAIYPNTPKPLEPVEMETVAYRGPWYYKPSPFSLRFDPYLEDLTETEVFFERIVKPKSFAKQKVEAGEFDAEAVKESGSGSDENRLTQWDREIAEKIGLAFSENDPLYKGGADEFFEVWRPHAPEPYLVIMNRKTIVNKNTDSPFWHRQLPYQFIRNIPVSGHPFGLSSYQQNRRTFKDRLAFRDLLLDALILAVMPVFLKSRGMGMTEMQRFLEPGMILDVPDVNGFKPGWTSMAGFAELMQVGQMLLGDQTSLSSTGDNVAGQAATIGRVSATESSSRLQQALVPHKKKAERLEEELSATLPQMYYNAYQKMPSDEPLMAQLRAQIIGEDEQDPFAGKEFTRENFAEALSINIKFRGATSKLNKELQAQQLKDFLATVSQIQSAAGMPVPVATPGELRTLMKRIYETYGQKGAIQVFTKEGDQAVALATQAYMLQAQTAPLAVQAQLLTAQQQVQQLQNPQPQPTPPNKVSESLSYRDAPPDVQRQIEQQAGLQPSQMGQMPQVDPRTGQPIQAEQMPQEAPVVQ